METAPSNESTPLLPITNESTNKIESDYNEKDLLSKKWWSSFRISKASKIHHVLSVIAILTILYPLFSIFQYLFSNKKYDTMYYIIDIHRFIISVVIFIGCINIERQKLLHQLFDKLYEEIEASTNYTNQSNCWQSFKFFILNIHYSWINIFILSGFFSLILPLIYPDMGQKQIDYLFPGLYPNFLSNCVRFYFVQQFWIVCYLLYRKYNQFKRIIELQDPNNCMDNLETNKEYYKRLSDLMKYVDDRIKNLILFFITASIIGTLIPIIEIWQLYIHKELSTDRTISILVIIFTSVYVLGYSLYAALRIPSEYNNAIELYYLKVGYTKAQDREKGFYKEYEFSKNGVFSKIPSLTFGGIFPLSVGFATLTVVSQLIPAMFALINLIPYHSVNGTATI